MKNLFLSKILLCHTHRRFKKAFDKVETLGYELYIRADKTSPSYERRVRNFVKNLGKLVALHDKFVGYND